MKLNVYKVLVLQKGAWQRGHIKDSRLYIDGDSNPPDDQYITLAKYLGKIGVDPKTGKTLQKKYECEKIYVSLKNPSDMSTGEWSTYFWGNYNKMCQKCKKSCKQSHLSSIICPEYKKGA